MTAFLLALLSTLSALGLGVSVYLYHQNRAKQEEISRMQMRHEEAITDMQKTLHKTHSEDRTKNEFIATLAHELRNPLAPVLSTLELLKEEQAFVMHRDLITSAETQAHIMRRLLDDLLDVARVSQRKFKLEKETVMLQTVIDQSVHTVTPFMQALDHQFSLAVPPEPIWLSGDPVRLTQIFTNILFNAAKYTPAHGVVTLVAARDPETVRVHITDTGVGIPSDMHDKIFEPFVQLRDQSRAGVGLGLGLGLSLTKRLVEMHDGQIDVASDGVGRGSTFTVTLPVPKRVQMAMPSAAPVPAKRSGAALSILIVDDNEAAAIGLQKLLEFKGHTVTAVFSGTDGIRTAEEIQPDVILLDIGLPDMPGYDVARAVRTQEDSRCTLVALTGFGQDEDKIKARAAGFDYHLVKPVGIADIEVILGKHSAGSPAQA